FDISSLALGVNRVEGEGGLTRAGETREHDEPVPGQLEIDVLQVVSPRATDDDGGHGANRRPREFSTIKSAQNGGKTRDAKSQAGCPRPRALCIGGSATFRTVKLGLSQDIGLLPGVDRATIGVPLTWGFYMARGINKVILVGNLGADPDTRYMPSGKAVTNIRVATSESWKDRQTGDQQERTEWHTVVLFDKLGEIAAEYLRKGSQVYIEGSLRTRKWQDKEGKDRYTTEIVAREMQMLGGRGAGAGAGGGESRPARSAPSEARSAPAATPDVGEFDDDIPF